MRPAKRIDVFLDVLKKEWKKNPDLRFTQFLYNNGLIDTNVAYTMEEDELLETMFPDIHPSEYLLWGTRGKDGKSKPKYILVKKLETDHIMNILATQPQISNKMKRTCIYILEQRGYTVDFLSKINV